MHSSSTSSSSLDKTPKNWNKSKKRKKNSLVRWLSSPPLQHIPPFKAPDPIRSSVPSSSPTLPTSPSEKQVAKKRRTIEALLEDESPLGKIHPTRPGSRSSLKRNKSVGDTTSIRPSSPTERRRNALDELSRLELQSLTSLSKHSPEHEQAAGLRNASMEPDESTAGKENRPFQHSVHEDVEKETIPGLESQIQAIHLENKESENSTPAMSAASFSDEFDSLDDNALHHFMTQYEETSDSNSQEPPEKFRRFLVLECQRQTDHANGSYLILRLFDEERNEEKWAHCRDEWADTLVTIGDYVNVSGIIDRTLKSYVIDATQGILILHPSKLLSCTTVADSFDCIRKSVLLNRIKPVREVSSPMIIGMILHEICQKGLVAQNWSLPYLDAELDQMIAASTENILAAGSTEEEIRTNIRQMFPALRQWFDRYAPVSEKAIQLNPPRIHDIVDIEETIRSPMYGLKGVVDITSTTRIVDPTTKRQRTLLVPVELKTGRAKAVSHRAQTTLYTLLMSDFYDVNVQDSFLAYLKSAEMLPIPSARDEIRSLLVQRNRLAFYLQEPLRLPSMIDNQRTCSRCPVQDYCMTYSKMLNEKDTPSCLDGIKYDQTAHLDPKHIDFLNQWERQLVNEESISARNPSQPWNTPLQYGEKRGQSVGYLVIRGSSVNNTGSFRYVSRLERQKANQSETWSFLQSSLNPGDPISVSHQETGKTLGTGYVLQLSKNEIKICSDRPLGGIPIRSHDFDEETNQVFEPKVHNTSIHLLESVPSTQLNSKTQTYESSSTLYRIDKEDYANGMALVRSNLFNLAGAREDKRRRDLIMDLKKPHFRPEMPLHEARLRGLLNPDQRKRDDDDVDIPLADDYVLLLGMPGTGKSTTITDMVDYLVSQGQSVLLTSYTHTAVDNLLLKLKNRDISFLRLGNKQKIHPAIQQYMDEKEGAVQSVVDLKKLYLESQVVAATCLGINHPIFTMRKFDYCIVDEASQIALPVCLGPLQFASVFVLVGDQYQLPPIIRSNSDTKDSSESSLFKVLAEAHPEAIVALHDQYRMNTSIMRLANSLIYNFALRCGNAKVADSRIHLPELHSRMSELHHSRLNAHCNVSHRQSRQCWLEAAVNPRMSVVFLNTDNVPATESNLGSAVINQIECSIVHEIVASLTQSGLDPREIGVISPYRSQIKHLQNSLDTFAEVEVDSVDRFQGRDKQCIIISFTRSNASKSVGDLLKDWRRLNVAVTRAKSKLIMVGSVTTLSSIPLFKYLIDEVKLQDALLELPPHQYLLHRSSPT